MKSTGISRPVDSLGRMVLPKELRSVMDIQKGDYLEILVDANRVILRKFLHNCIFCGEGSDVSFYHGKAVCRKCADYISKRFGV